jgi:methionyl-tRNA formyltransferase
MPLKICAAEISPASTAAPPGTVLLCDSNGIDIACGSGIVRILQLQPAGRRRMTAEQFLAGHTLAPSTRLGIDRTKKGPDA